MLTEKTQPNRYQLDKAIKKYHDNICKYMRMKDELDCKYEPYKLTMSERPSN